MKIAMTAKEFESAVRKKLAAITGAYTTSGVAAEVLMEAGLEFAPEPVRLPKRLELDSRGFIRPEGSIFLWNSDEEREAGHALARDRYNAYPALRKKAEELAQKAHGLCNSATVAAINEGTFLRFRDSLQALDDELIRGGW